MPLSSQMVFHLDPVTVETRAEASSSAAAFRMNAGIESGPVALCVLRFINSSWTFQSTLISGMLGVVLVPLSGILVRSSCVKTDLNCTLRISALALVSLWRKPSFFFNGATPLNSCPLLITCFHGPLKVHCNKNNAVCWNFVFHLVWANLHCYFQMFFLLSS